MHKGLKTISQPPNLTPNTALRDIASSPRSPPSNHLDRFSAPVYPRSGSDGWGGGGRVRQCASLFLPQNPSGSLHRKFCPMLIPPLPRCCTMYSLWGCLLEHHPSSKPSSYGKASSDCPNSHGIFFLPPQHPFSKYVQ